MDTPALLPYSTQNAAESNPDIAIAAYKEYCHHGVLVTTLESLFNPFTAMLRDNA